MTESERAEIVHVDPAVVGPRLEQLLVQQLVVPYEAVPVERPAERDGQRPVVRLRGGQHLLEVLRGQRADLRVRWRPRQAVGPALRP